MSDRSGTDRTGRTDPSAMLPSVVGADAIRMLLGRAECPGDLGAARDAYVGKTVLITGAGGTIGAELARQMLACAPTRLILFELNEFMLFTLDRKLRHLTGPDGPDVVPVLGNVTDDHQVRRVLREWQPDIILHAAAYKHVTMVEANPAIGLRNNVLGTRVLARAAQAEGVARFILISSDKAVRPKGVMGASKRLAEIVVQDLASRGGRTVFAAVRFGNVLGSSGSVLPLFHEQIARGGPLEVTHPDATRYFMTVGEAVALVLRGGALAEGGDILSLDMGPPLRILDLAKQVLWQTGHTLTQGHAIRPQDIGVVFTGLRPGEKLHEEPPHFGGTRSAAHPMLFVCQDQPPSQLEVAVALRALTQAISDGDDDTARHIALQWATTHNKGNKAGVGAAM